ncbi:hypothetical protein [Pseudomonas sp. Irchel 3E13]|uniref:hypothetical protein n=1 Tax=Pseudomonas sp. Irchel 3E13 TaxID=2008975 RepID=UPI000BA49C4B|nr:hypothetical protein [Pseudomonas sp. Irchel 3E13]
MSIFFSCAVAEAEREPIRQALQSLDSAAASLGLSASLQSLAEHFERPLASGELEPTEDFEKCLLLAAVCVNLGAVKTPAPLIHVASGSGDFIALDNAKECDAFLQRSLDPEQYKSGVEILISLDVLPKPLDLTSLANAFEAGSFCL